MGETSEIRKKRLLHRSHYRGILEADILFGRFSEAHLAGFSDAELDLYELLIEEGDHDLLAWVAGTRPVPARHDHAIMRRLKAFRVTV